jgi:hypothetical protein
MGTRLFERGQQIGTLWIVNWPAKRLAGKPGAVIIPNTSRVADRLRYGARTVLKLQERENCFLAIAIWINAVHFVSRPQFIPQLKIQRQAERKDFSEWHHAATRRIRQGA